MSKADLSNSRLTSAAATPAGASGSPQTVEANEQRIHHRALFRGQALLILAFALLLVFGAVTAIVVLANPVSLDLPITLEVQDLNFGPATFLLEAVSAPGLSPYKFIIHVEIVHIVT